MKKFVIIDGNAIIHRCYHALPKTFRSPAGDMTNAVYGFTTILLGILEYEKPDFIATAWDMKGPTFRHADFAEYKATRAKTDDELISQFPLAYKVLDALSIPMFKKEGLEADDYLGIVAKKLEDEEKEIRTIIVTGDQDALQLVRPDTEVVAPISGYTKVKRYDRAAVKEKLGVWPEQIPDYKGLCGDSSDNIPGVPGIGKKTASKLLDKFGDLDELYERVDEVEPERIRGLLKEHEESARMSKKVATILTEDGELDFSVDACKVHEFDMGAVRDLFAELAFRKPLKKIERLNKEWEKKRVAEQQTSLF